MSEISGLRNRNVTVDDSSLSLTFDGKWDEQITVSMPADHLDKLMILHERIQQEVSVDAETDAFGALIVRQKTNSVGLEVRLIWMRRGQL